MDFTHLLINASFFVVTITFVIISMKYLNKSEIKFYEKAQIIETKIKDDDDLTFDEIVLLFKNLKKYTHGRNAHHRVIELRKMIEVRFHKELENNN